MAGNFGPGVLWLLKRYILQPFEAWLFQHQNAGTPPFTRQCSGVFHVRIPGKGAIRSGWVLGWVLVWVGTFGVGFGITWF